MHSGLITGPWGFKMNTTGSQSAEETRHVNNSFIHSTDIY